VTAPDEYSAYLGSVPGVPWVVFEEFAWGDLLDPNVVHDFVWEGDDEEDDE
jgi:hypothetical protein